MWHQRNADRGHVTLDITGSASGSSAEGEGRRLPPGQRLTEGWPVLHYGGIPRIDLAQWEFGIVGLVEQEVALSWDQFMALPQVRLRTDIHCVTAWEQVRQ